MVTLTYLLVGKGLNMFLVCKSKLKSSELDCQWRLGDKFIENFLYLASVWFWFQCGNAISESQSKLKGFPMCQKWVGYIK